MATEIRLFGTVGEDFTSRGVADQVAALSDDDLLVRINSGGGNLFDGLAIYNILQRHGNATADIEGAALSAAAVIAMAGRRIRMAGGALMMVHSPMHLVGGTISDHESSIEMLRRGEQSTIDIFVRRTRLPRQRIADMLTNETWISAQEAIQLGFADELITAAERIAASVGDLHSHWDRAVERSRTELQSRRRLRVTPLQARNEAGRRYPQLRAAFVADFNKQHRRY